MELRIFKENSLCDDVRTVSTLNEAASIYRQYSSAGYSVRVVEVSTGLEYAMWNEQLVRVPYTIRRRRVPEWRWLHGAARIQKVGA